MTRKRLYLLRDFIPNLSNNAEAIKPPRYIFLDAVALIHIYNIDIDYFVLLLYKMNNENVKYAEYDIKKQAVFDDIVNIKDESVRKKVRPTTEEIDELFEVENPQVRERYNNFHLNLFFEFIIRLLELLEPKKKEKIDTDERNLKLIIMTGQFLKPYLDSKHKKYLAEGLHPFLGELRHYKALLTVNNPPYIEKMRDLEEHFELNDLEEFNLDKREKQGSELKPVELPPPPPSENSNLPGNLNSNVNSSGALEGRIRRKKNKKKGSVKHGNVKSGSNASKKKRKRKSKNLRK